MNHYRTLRLKPDNIIDPFYNRNTFGVNILFEADGIEVRRVNHPVEIDVVERQPPTLVDIDQSIRRTLYVPGNPEPCGNAFDDETVCCFRYSNKWISCP